MEIGFQQHVLDDAFVDFDSWYNDVTSNQFYAEESFFSKQGSRMQNTNSMTKFSSHTAELKYSNLLSVDAMDARVPEFETSNRSLSCSSLDETPQNIKPHTLKNPVWDAFFSKNQLTSIQSEDSISHISTFVGPDVGDENETFRDLTELLEQEYPLSKVTSPPHSLVSDLQTLDIPCSSNAITRSEDSRSSSIGSFSADLSPESPCTSKGVDKRYKEMRRKNNIASKNARVARREKEKQMEERAKQLEQDNQALRIKVRRMEEMAQELKTRLIQSVKRNR